MWTKEEEANIAKVVTEMQQYVTISREDVYRALSAAPNDISALNKVKHLIEPPCFLNRQARRQWMKKFKK